MKIGTYNFFFFLILLIKNKGLDFEEGLLWKKVKKAI